MNFIEVEFGKGIEQVKNMLKAPTIYLFENDQCIYNGDIDKLDYGFKKNCSYEVKGIFKDSKLAYDVFFVKDEEFKITYGPEFSVYQKKVKLAQLEKHSNHGYF